MKSLRGRSAIFGTLFLVLFLGSCTKRVERDSRVVLDRAYKDEILKSRDLLAVNLLISHTGLSIAVSVDNKTVWSEGLGYANAELRTMVKPEYKFRIGTSSRLFTSLLLLRMQERGEIDLSKKYTDYVSAEVNPEWSFSLYQLAVNSAGLDLYTDDLFREATVKKYANLDSLLAAHRHDKLKYEVNQYFAENTVGACMLAKAAEKVSGKTYRELFKSEVLTPFGLSETQLDYPRFVIKNKASLYARNSIAQVYTAEDGNINTVAPALGILSTADDLNKLGRALMNHEVLSADSYHQLLEPNKLLNGDKSVWGMGIEVTEDNQGDLIYMLRGKVEGGASLLIINPKEKLVVSICGNLSADYSSYPFTQVVGLFMDKLKK
ncbi:MAG: serine hydrolase domain-containing protein [Mangrovibacterium sp.]